jgi:hypothetical protein
MACRDRIDGHVFGKDADRITTSEDNPGTWQLKGAGKT